MKKGIAYLIAKQDKKIRDWNRIEKLARAAGIYKPTELAALIRANSPIRQIGQHNLEICKIIADEKILNPKKSLHAIIKDNLKRLMLINGDDFRQLHWGMEWEKLQESKSKKFDRKKFQKYHSKSYIQQIKNFEKKYSNMIKKNKNIFFEWCKENADYLGEMNKFLDSTIREIENPKAHGTAFFNGKEIKY